MLNARVVGIATATVKHDSLQGERLLVVQAYGPDGETPDGDPVLAVDRFGASRGSCVIITSDGLTARTLLQSETTPVRWTVAGITDT